MSLFCLFDFVLEVLPSHQIRNIIIVVVLLIITFRLLHRLVAFGQLSERSKGVGAELVEDSWNELGELFVLTVAVDRKGVGWYCSVDCRVENKLA